MIWIFGATATYGLASWWCTFFRLEDSVCCDRHRQRHVSENEVRTFFFWLSSLYVTINSIIQQLLTIYNTSSFSYSIVIESSADGSLWFASTSRRTIATRTSFQQPCRVAIHVRLHRLSSYIENIVINYAHHFLTLTSPYWLILHLEQISWGIAAIRTSGFSPMWSVT